MNRVTAFFQGSDHQYEDATNAQRLTNYMIDMLTFYIFLSVLYRILVMVNMQTIFQDNMRMALYLVNIIVYITYICLSEKLGHGRSLGKLVTHTVAIQKNGAPLRWRDALTRSLCRVIPFEIFSALAGYPWHDKWTNTRVVKMK